MNDASSPAILRIATLNCLNLTRPGHAPYAEIAAPSAAEYDARLDWLAAMLVRLDADFVLVQEVFHASALAAAVARTGLALDCLAPLAADGNDRPRLGLVWRRTWQPRIESIADFPAGAGIEVPELSPQRTFSRPLLRATVAAGDGVELALFNLHLKSRRPVFAPGDDPQDPRAIARGELRALLVRGAEAAAARTLICDCLATGSAVIAGGDFNDGPHAVTTRIVKGGSLSDDGLADALDLAPPGSSAAATFVDGGLDERIDHLLASHHFAAHSGAAASALFRVLAVETFAEHLQRATAASGAGSSTAPDAPEPVRIESDHAAVRLTATRPV